MSTFASSSDASSSDALARCAAFQREAAIEGAAAAIDGAGASGAAHDLFVERFVAFAVLQERHRAGRLLAGDDAAPLETRRRARAGMVGAFSDGGSTVLGCLEPSALEARVGADAAATIERAVRDLRRAFWRRDRARSATGASSRA
ncbi:hypothetical protein SO694_00124080 [Aureococcus anophagefferens]|uniref:RGS domain-containing protein n=1 Tax=Aureococcus anophagefferens TaxID=44056 RepID=A0ABR1G3I0_AURAN